MSLDIGVATVTHIFMLSNCTCGGYSVRYGDEYQEKRTIHSRSREEDGRSREFLGTKEDEVFLRASGRFQQGVAVVLSPGRPRQP